MAKKGKSAKKAAGEEPGVKVIARNRKAFRDFHVIERFEAGLSLQGSEVKSLRQAAASLQEGYARVRDGEAWLIGVTIPVYENAGYAGHEPDRVRKLLLRKREIQKLKDSCARQSLTIVPLSLYFKRGYAKVELGLVKGKKHEDRRQDMKQKDAKREVERALARARRE